MNKSGALRIQISAHERKRGMNHLRKGIAVFAACMFMSADATSDTLYVPLEYPFIQDAINVAQTGDVIEISAGEYGYAEINQTHPCGLTLQARSDNGVFDEVSILELDFRSESCGNKGFNLVGLNIDFLDQNNQGSDVTIDRCLVRRLLLNSQTKLNAISSRFVTSAGNRLINNNSTSNFQDCAFELEAIGVLVDSGFATAFATFSNCIFEATDMQEPLIQNAYGDVSLRDCTLECHPISSKAGVYNLGSGGSSQLPRLDATNISISGFSTGILHETPTGLVSIDGSHLTDNSGPDNFGGGLYINGGTEFILSNSTIDSNSSESLGGGLYIRSNSNVSISNCIISNNTAGNYGGGILITESIVSIQDTQVCGNSPDQISGQWGDLGENTVATFCPCPDCNGNGISDCEDISTGSSSDLNGNNIPDECDPDCDSDGFPDFIEIDQGELDCNRNGVPDFCEVFLEEGNDTNSNGIHDDCESDCNKNGVFDFIDISNANSVDSDENGIPDECDQCANSPDCNQNGEADACEIVFGDTVDINMNLVPDECECVCDVVPNGSVDFSDAILVISSWGPCAAPCPADIVADGEVRYEDLIRVFSNWGPCP